MYPSGPQPELDIWWRHPNFQHGAQTKGHDPGSLFSSLLRLEMTFSHSTLVAAPLYDEEARECEKKWHPMKSGCSLEVKQLKTGVFQLKDLPDKAQNIWR